jgi:hypothetical protein
MKLKNYKKQLYWTLQTYCGKYECKREREREKKKQSNPETGLNGIEGSGRLRLPDFLTVGTLRW